MYRYLRERLAAAIASFLLQKYGLGGVLFAIEETPRVELGEYALPLAFQLAKRLKKAPVRIAQEIVNEIGPIEGFEKLEVAGAGYINARVDRGQFAEAVLRDALPEPTVPQPKPRAASGKILVEHGMQFWGTHL